MKSIYLNLFIFISISLISQTAFSQIEWPSPSPKGTITQMVGNTAITVDYERPSARGREIFGGLVPWDKVWRTGAGYATKIRFDKDVMAGNQPVGAGYYALLTIPGKEEWMIILNRDTTLYGSNKYDYQKDVARFTVPARKSARYYETLTIDIDLIPNNARIYISWTNISVSYEVKTTTDERVMAYIDQELLTGKSTDSDSYAYATEYLLFQNTRNRDALTLAQKSKELGGGGYAGRLIMDSYEKMGYLKEALDEAKDALEFRKKNPLGDEFNQNWDLNFWKEHIARLEKKIAQN